MRSLYDDIFSFSKQVLHFGLNIRYTNLIFLLAKIKEPVNNIMTEVQYLLDGASQKEYRDSKAICSTYVEFNGKPMDLAEAYEYTIKAPKDIKYKV